MTQPDADRRLRRSDDPLVALHFQLSKVRHEGKLLTVVVADDQGLVVAGAGSWAACEELAAYAPLLAAGESVGLYDTAAKRQRVTMETVEVDGVSLLLCSDAAGTDPALALMRKAALARTAQGISRILRLGDA